MNTSWNKASGWYGKIVGESGHHFHQEVLFPKLLPLLDLKPTSKVLDVGCGNGVFVSQLPTGATYFGLDSASSLISQAPAGPNKKYFVADATKSYPFPDSDFTHAVFVLSLQNMEQGSAAILEAGKRIRSGGVMAIILNHPAFRIPRQSSWQIDEGNKTEYRRIDRYLSPLKIPVTTHPGQPDSGVTWSFHHPISDYTHWLKSAGLKVTSVEEWASDKASVGKKAKMENRARSEFPLFMAILAQKG
ncbi:MAG: class I SAM-dependent methyltransferase [Patescibacteria group bacterium]